MGSKTGLAESVGTEDSVLLDVEQSTGPCAGLDRKFLKVDPIKQIMGRTTMKKEKISPSTNSISEVCSARTE